jgi:GntR family transcriptional repressor for pyruvate dehydrogenase complex
LDVRRGDGTYVRSLQPSDLLSGMGFALELVQARGLDEVLEVRRLLFPPAAGLAAQRVTVGQLNAMRAIIEELEIAEDSEKIAELHRQFQGIVADATGNAWLSSILHTLQIEGEQVRRAWLNSGPPMREAAIAHQKLILDALERRDSEMARSIALIQVDARRRWLEHLRTTPVDVDGEQLPVVAS